MEKISLDRKLRRKRRIRGKINGESTKPRISIFRSNKYIYGQAIDDAKGITLAAFSSLQLKKDKDKKLNKSSEAKLIGQELGKLLKSKKITTAIYDRNVYGYKGRVKELCEGLRESGINI